MTKRIPWLIIGFILGVMSQDDAATQIAYDLGVWTRGILGLAEKSS